MVGSRPTIKNRFWAHGIATGIIIECGSYKTIVGGLQQSRGGAWQQCPCPPTLTKHNVQQTIGHILIHHSIMEEHNTAHCTTLSSPPLRHPLLLFNNTTRGPESSCSKTLCCFHADVTLVKRVEIFMPKVFGRILLWMNKLNGRTFRNEISLWISFQKCLSAIPKLTDLNLNHQH